MVPPADTGHQAAALWRNPGDPTVTSSGQASSLIPSPLVLGQARSHQARASKVATHARAAQGKAAKSLSSRRKPLRSHSRPHGSSDSALMIPSHSWSRGPSLRRSPDWASDQRDREDIRETRERLRERQAGRP